jgi:hypothetical protein
MTGPRTEDLIGQLAAQASPVKRLLPPAARAGLWIASFAILSAIAIWWFGTYAQSATRFSDLTVQFEFIGSLLTGVTALIAAFFVSLPDRSKAWLALPILPLALWLSGSGYGCYLHLIEFGPRGWEIGDSWNCFWFILGISIPASGALWFALRRSMPLDPMPPLIAGGLGVAGLAAAALQFFHPFDITFLDLGVHIVAIAIVIGVLTLFGRRGLAAA